MSEKFPKKIFHFSVKVIEPYGEFPVTTLTIWNKVAKGVLIAGYGSGHIRIFTIPVGAIVAEITAHAGWITGMDLASVSGLLVTSSEDGFITVSCLKNCQAIIKIAHACHAKCFKCFFKHELHKVTFFRL